jgi:hypothetical protein
MTALTAAVQELRAAMSALASLLGSTSPTGVGAVDRSYMSSTSSSTTPHGAADAECSAFNEQAIRGNAGNERNEGNEETERPATDEAKAATAIGHRAQIQDYVPALSANRPAAFLRADSAELAAAWTGRLGDWESGGDGGGDEYQSLSSYPSHPSRSGPPTDFETTERLAEAIGRLADAILNGGGRSGSALHPGEAQGGLNSLLQAAKVGARPDGYN